MTPAHQFHIVKDPRGGTVVLRRREDESPVDFAGRCHDLAYYFTCAVGACSMGWNSALSYFAECARLIAQGHEGAGRP